MSITLISKPAQWARVNDTNRMNYKFASTNWQNPNFNFLIKLYKSDWDLNLIDIGTFYLYPLPDGTCNFNPSIIYKNFISYDFNINNTCVDETLDSASRFKMSVWEYYGTPPTIHYGTFGVPGYEETDWLRVYNGAQQHIPYDYIPLNSAGNEQWVMSVGATKGQFLTDAPQIGLGNDDHAFLYALGTKPTRVRYKIRWWDAYGDIPKDSPNGSTSLINQAVANSGPVISLDDIAKGILLADTGSTAFTGPQWKTAVIYDTSLCFDHNNSFSYYFPIGPYQAINGSNVLATYTDTWGMYEIDLMSGTTILNKSPFVVYRNDKCDKYGKWQLFWLNPHGGFDTYTFDMKIDIDYNTERVTYKQRMKPEYTTYQAGERVLKVNSTEVITLRTNLITQIESQLLIQMVQSPVVYAKKIYNYGGGSVPYGVPYIVENTQTKYANKRNDKEVYMEIQIRPSNEKIVQGD